LKGIKAQPLALIRILVLVLAPFCADCVSVKCPLPITFALPLQAFRISHLSQQQEEAQ